MMNRQYSKIKKPIYCPNAHASGFSKHSVSEGDLIAFRIRVGDHDEDRFVEKYGRVLGRVNYDGVHKQLPKKPATLAVLTLSANAAHAHLLFTEIGDVLDVMDPARYAVFAKWFFSSKMPKIETVIAAQDYGSLSAGYIEKYLDSDGNFREDWREVNKVTPYREAEATTK